MYPWDEDYCHSRFLADESPSPETPDTDPSVNIESKSTNIRPFGERRIVVERRRSNKRTRADPVKFTIFRVVDIVKDIPGDTSKDPGSITINDVDFSKFLEEICADEDLNFQEASDEIYFTFEGSREKAIKTERVWRVALEDMLRQDMETIVFTVKSKH